MISAQVKTIFGAVPKRAGSKLCCHLGLSVWIAFFYYGPQLWPIMETRPSPVIFLDQWIPLQPGWALVYQSVFITHTLALWLPGNVQLVKSYTLTLAIAFMVSSLVFWLFPTISPRPLESTSPLYTWLITKVDGERNAFPSLHATMTVLGMLTLFRHLRSCRVARQWTWILGGWLICLLYSTLATRQHRFLDLIAGISMGLFLTFISSRIIRTSFHHEPITTSRPEPALP